MNDTELLRLAWQAAAASPDPSTQNGAILATPAGDALLPTAACNEFPRGVAYRPERWERPGKYAYIEHAERNTIFRAAHRGLATRGLLLACPFAACADCARAIIQAGIGRLITLKPTEEATHERWDASIAVAMGMLSEAGVDVTYLAHLGAPVSPLRREGKSYAPAP